MTDSLLIAIHTLRGDHLCFVKKPLRIKLPYQKIIERFGDVEYFDVAAENNKIVLKPVKISSFSDLSLLKIRKKISSLGHTEKDIEDAIKWAREK